MLTAVWSGIIAAGPPGWTGGGIGLTAPIFTWVYELPLLIMSSEFTEYTVLLNFINILASRGIIGSLYTYIIFPKLSVVAVLLAKYFVSHPVYY